MTKHIHLTATIPDEFQGVRLDSALAKLFPDYSRAKLQSWLKQGNVLINGNMKRGREKCVGGENIVISTELAETIAWQAENIKLDIVHEDDALIVVNKPPNLVVHPAHGNPAGTLVNALLHHHPELNLIPRAGIVHRLDKDTSGILVIAKTLATHTYLVSQIQRRLVKREYDAVVAGVMTAGGSIDQPIGRHPQQRKKMAINPEGKPAITHYRVKQKFRAHTWVRLQLETGRTHQIRVHLASIYYPIVGDQTYGGRLKLPAGASEALIMELRSFKRQALHASTLGLTHPQTQAWCEWSVALPPDMQHLIDVLTQAL